MQTNFEFRKNLYGNSNYVNETITLQGLELSSCNICYSCVGRLLLKIKTEILYEN